MSEQEVCEIACATLAFPRPPLRQPPERRQHTSEQEAHELDRADPAFPPPLKKPPTSVTHTRARPMFDNRVLDLFEAFTTYFDHSWLTQCQPKSPSQDMPPLLWEITFWPKVERASPARSSNNEAGLYGQSQLRCHLCQRGSIISFPPARGDGPFRPNVKGAPTAHSPDNADSIDFPPPRWGEEILLATHDEPMHALGATLNATLHPLKGTQKCITFVFSQLFFH
jgi:hypothetical protein